MFKIKKKIKFKHSENRMKNEGNVSSSILNFEKNKNLFYLLKERYNWMNNFISKDHDGIEVGAAGGFTKKFIKCKNFKISDFADHDHLDYKNIDAQKTGFEDKKFNFVISSNMIHHLPFPLKFFNEMHRILKKGGKLIIFDAYCSTTLQIVLILMKHEGFDFTKNVWSYDEPATDKDDLWSGNSAIPYLIFKDKKKFDEKLGDKFQIKYQEICECLLFLNSGGVTSKAFYIPLNSIFLKFIILLDKLLSIVAPSFFSLAYKIVLERKD
jgi:SAM-dependent methyltransferase